MLRPGRIHIAAQHRKCFSVHNDTAAPSGGGIIRNLHPGFQRHPFQRAHMLHAFLLGGRAASAVSVFIFQLDAYNWASVLCHLSCRLLPDLLIKAAHLLQIAGIIAAQPAAEFFRQPVREPAVAAFPMGPGPDAQPHLHANSAAGLQKDPQITAAAKVPLTAPFLMVDPENIGCRHRDAARFHLQQFFLPVLRLISGKMKLPHYRQKASAVFHQA